MSGKRRKPWRVRTTMGWTEDGKQIYHNVGNFATRKEALEALAQWNVSPMTASGIARKEKVVSGLTFAEVYNAMYKYRETKASEATLQNYSSSFKNLEQLHGQIFVQIRKPQLQKAFDDCPLSSATKAKMKVLLNAVYRYAIENEVIEVDYSKQIEMEKKTNKNEHNPFTEEEIEKIWSYADTDDIAKIVLIQIYTGCRANELLLLEKDNVFLEKEYAIGGIKTEAGKDRIIPLHKRIIPLLSHFYNNDRDFLFINSRGLKMQYDGFGVNFRSRMKKWGMPGHQTHDCRRTCATRLNVADVPYHITKQILGHNTKSTDVTARYITKDAKQLIKYINYVK